MRAVRLIIRRLAFLLLLVVALAAGAIDVLTLTVAGRQNLAGMISKLASSETSGVRVSGLSGIWSGPLRIDTVVLSDADGPWLAARGVAVEWSPLALLSSRFEASLIHADRIELARLPTSEPGASGEGGLPVSVAIDRIDLPEIALGDLLAGQVAQVSAEGSLRAEAEPLTIVTEMKIARTDGRAGTLEAMIDFAPAANRLAIDIRGAEPAGGIIAGVLNLPGTPPVEIAVSGTGPAADWSVEGTFSVAGEVVTKVVGRRQLTDKGNRIEARGEGAFARFMPEMVRQLLAGRSTFDVAGTLGDDGAVEVEHANLQSAALALSASGVVDPTAASDFVLEATARGEPAKLAFGGVAMDVRHVTLRAFGTGEAPAIDASAEVAKLVTPQAEFTGIAAKLHSDGFDLFNRSGPLAFSAAAETGGSVDETVAGLLAGSPKLDLAGTLSGDNYRIDSGTVVTDTANAAVSGSGSLADGGLKLDVKADLLAVLTPQAARASLGERISLSATVARDGSDNVSIEPFAISSGDVEASGRILYRPEALDVVITGSFGDLSRLSPDVRGRATFEVTAQGAPAAPEISATVSSTGLDILDRLIDSLSVTAKTTIGAADPSVVISLAGTAAGRPLGGGGTLRFAGGTRRIDGLSLTLGQNRIEGSLAFDDAFMPQGTLDFSLADVGPLAALANERLAGAIDGAATFSAVAGVPQIAVDARAATLTRDDLKVADAQVAAVVADYRGDPKVSGSVKVRSLEVGSTTASDLAVELTRAGEWTDFSGSATVAGLATKAEGRLALADETTTVELASLSASGNGFQAALPAKTTITIGSARAGLDLALRFEAGGASASLVLNQGSDVVSVSLKQAAIRIAGPSERSMVDVSAIIDRLESARVELTGIRVGLHSDAFDLTSQTGPLTLSATADAGGSPDETIAGLLAGKLRADIAATASPTGLTISKGTIAGDSLDAAASGSIFFADGSLTLDLKASLLSALMPEAARSALDKHVVVTGSVTRDAAGAIRLDPIDVTSGAFDAAGRVSYAPDKLAVQLKGGFADISKLSPDAAGAIGFEVAVSGSPTVPDISATITSEQFTAAGRDITGLSVTASGEFDPANPAADVTIKGDVAGQALAGAARLATVDGQRRIDGMTLTLGQNRIAGDLTLDPAFTPQGTLTLSLPDLGPLAALALEEVFGSVNGTVRFLKAEGVPQVDIAAKAAKIVRGDLTASGVEVSARVANYLLAPAVTGKIKAAAVTSGATILRAIDFSLTRDGAWTGFTGGAAVNDIAAKASGRLAIANGTTTIELASASASTRGVLATLERPTIVSVKEGTAALDRLALAVQGGRVEVTGTAGQQLNLNIRIAALPASVINAFVPGLGAAGAITGTARITGAAANPNIGYTLDWKGAQTVQTRDAGFGAMSIASSGTLDAGILQFTANLGDGSGLGLKGGGSVDTGRRTLSLEFSGQVPFGFLTRRLAAQGLALSGTSTVSLTVRGAIAAPVVGGSITTIGARLVDARSGIAVNDIAADIAIASGVATIRRLTGKLSSGGSLSGSGTVGIDATKGFPADLAIKVSDARYTDGRIVTTNVSGDVVLKGPLAAQPQLSGTVNLAKTVITIPDRLPASIATLGVQHRNATPAVRRQSEALQPASAGNSGSGLTLDLTVNAPQQIYVRGRGLDAELGGSIKLTGPLASPRAVGTFTLRRGRLSVLARRLDFTRGTLGFSGSLVPTIDFAADSTVSDATVTASVRGLATDPKFSFTSSPSLPEDEVLARLIFGRSMSNLSALQIAQLADAAAQLAGAGGSTSLLNTLRGKIGVDDLDIKTDEKGNAAVSAGKYLNDRTYVTIQKGDKAGSGKATIDLDIGRGVKLRGEVNESGGGKGGIFYEREY